MLDVERFIQFKRLRNEVSIKFVQFLIEQCGEVFWQLVGLLKTRSQSVSKGSNVRYVMIFTQFWLILYTLLEVSFVLQHPSKNCVLYFLVVFLLKEIIMEKLH